MSRAEFDAVIVGSGPNGLSAAIVLAAAGWKTLVLEARDSIGGGLRTSELTLPGFRHDVCSAIHPLAVESPLFRTLPLERYGLNWLRPKVALAHPMPDGSAVAVTQSLSDTARELGEDENNYGKLVAPFVDRAAEFFPAMLRPLRVPAAPGLMARFGWRGMRSAESLAFRTFQNERTRGMFAGMAAHAMIPLDARLTGAVGMMFCIAAHANGWPLPQGGSQSLADALASHLRSIGGSIETNRPVKGMNDIPASRAVLFDLSPRQVVDIAGEELSHGYRRSLERFRYGPGVFKIDYALSEPVPWTAPACRVAGTVHVGGAFEEIAAAERAAANGVVVDRPFVLVAQQSLIDPSRAPPGKHTLWAYCHVPNGSIVDMTERIERQLERFAPGFRDVVLARHTLDPMRLQVYNQNYIGGDIGCGVMNWRQTVARPVWKWDPYATSNRRLFIGSSATPPGPGVHGMCGFHAAQSVLRHF